VDRWREDAVAVARRLADEHGSAPETAQPVDGDFDSWLASDRLAKFVADMSARPF
jgi:hypothetical protein